MDEIVTDNAAQNGGTRSSLVESFSFKFCEGPLLFDVGNVLEKPKRTQTRSQMLSAEAVEQCARATFTHKRAKREDRQLRSLPLEGATAPESNEQTQLLCPIVTKPGMGSFFVTETYIHVLVCFKQTDRRRSKYS